MIPNHSSNVLKLLSRQGISTEAETKNQRAHGIINQGSSHSLSQENVGLNANRHPTILDTGDQSVPAAVGSMQNTSPKAKELDYSSRPQSVSDANPEFDIGSGTILVNIKEPFQASNSEVHPTQVDRTSDNLMAIGTTSKPPPRPRTVGSSELKALLESHDRGNTVNNTPGTPLGIIHTQLLTRAKAISYKAGKAVASCGDASETGVQSNSQPANFPGIMKSAYRKLSSSIKVLEKTAITPSTEKQMVDESMAVLKAADASKFCKVNHDGAVHREKIPSLLCQNRDMPKPSKQDSINNDLSRHLAGGASPIEKPTLQKIKLPVSRSEKRVETEETRLTGTGKEVVKSGAQVEVPVIETRRRQIKKPTFRGQRPKEVGLQAGAGSAAQLNHAVDEAQVTSQEVSKAKRVNLEALGDPESPRLQTPTTRNSQQPAVVHAAERESSDPKLAENPVRDFQEIQEQKAPTPVTVATHSILTYSQARRQVGKQEEEHFKASGVLMGVRYVVVGSETRKGPEVRHLKGEKDWKVALA
jgi:hypothetical protein